MPNSPRTKVCSGWCGPTIIYAILATISTVLAFIHPDLKSHQERGVVLLANVINGLFWTGVLYLLCSYCYEGFAWVLLLIPFMIAFLMLLFVTAIALSLIRNKSGGHIHAQVTKTKEGMANHDTEEDMANYQATAFASVPGSNFPDQVLNLQSVKPTPHAPTHAKGVCDYAARPSKFNVMTQKQLQAPGSYITPPGSPYNFSANDANTPSGCHEGFPPNPIVKYAMPTNKVPSA